MAGEHRREVRIAPGREYGERMTESPYHEPGEPLLEAEAECRGECAVDDRDRARRPAEQDRLDERAVQRRLEAVDVGGAHAIRAPPPKLKKDRKNERAAKAIDRPNTIWIRRRNPPAVSPNAKVRPVTMMMITATILATGPCTDSSTCWSGSSQGMPEPAAWAVAARASTAAEPVRAIFRIADKRIMGMVQSPSRAVTGSEVASRRP